MVLLRVQRAAGQLPGAAGRDPRQRRKPSGPRQRHRSDHARHRQRAVGRRRSRPHRTARDDLEAIRRRLEHRHARRLWPDGRGPRSARHPADGVCPTRPPRCRCQRERCPAQPRLSGRVDPVARAGHGAHCRWRERARRTVRREPEAGPLLLRMGLLRQRREHDGRSQRVSVAKAARRRARPSGDDPHRRRHRRRARSRHEQGGCRRHGLPTFDSVGGRADPQPLHGPHVHRRRLEPSAEGRIEIHASPRGARGQAGDPRRGFDRAEHDDEGAAGPDAVAGTRSGDPCSDRLSADRRTLLLRHRHVDD